MRKETTLAFVLTQYSLSEPAHCPELSDRGCTSHSLGHLVSNYCLSLPSVPCPELKVRHVHESLTVIHSFTASFPSLAVCAGQPVSLVSAAVWCSPLLSVWQHRAFSLYTVLHDGLVKAIIQSWNACDHYIFKVKSRRALLLNYLIIFNLVECETES